MRVSGSTKKVDVLVDGDYDGEWFESLIPWMLVNSSGHVAIMKYAHDYLGLGVSYLHHLVLPEKKGFWRVFSSGNKLDCRSANVIYRTTKEHIKVREERKREKLYRDYQYRMNNPRKD